jgi:hypothetical protein
MKHSLFSASGAEGWSNCPGKLVFTRGMPDSSSEASREGTAGHALGDHCLKLELEPEDHVGEVFEKYEITEDLASAVQKYVDYVRGISGIRLSEIRVFYGRLLGVEDEEAFGTSDVIIVAGRVLHVIDAKFGRRFVDPKNNKQMILYGAGALEALLAVGEADDIDELHLHIMQPRVSEKPMPYIMSRAELDEQIALLRAAADLAVEADINYVANDPRWAEKYLIPGEYQCQWCRGAAACPSLRLRAKSTTPLDEFELVNALEALPAATVGENMALVPLLEIWIKAVEHEGFRRLTRGDYIPGFKMVSGREGNRKWGNEEDVLTTFQTDLAASGMEVDDIDELLHAEPKLKTAPQLEKALKKLKAKDAAGTPLVEKIKGLTVRSPARPAITTEDDPRPKWVESAGIEEFGVVAE